MVQRVYRFGYICSCYGLPCVNLQRRLLKSEVKVIFKTIAMDYAKTELTFTQDRKCRHCSCPIADQVHAARLYCEPYELEDGSIQDCKEEYNSAVTRAEMEHFKPIAYYHRDVTRTLKQLIDTNGEQVTLEDINEHGIRLDRSLRFERAESGLYTFYFKFYGIQQLNNSQFKLFTHELL